MTDQNPHLDTLKDIKQMMERSSRFISLSGLSGIAAGICALIGAWFANGIIDNNKYAVTNLRSMPEDSNNSISIGDWMGNQLFQIAVFTFIAAFILAFIFTYIRSKKTNTPIWGAMAKRVLINVAIPMIVGGIYLLKLMENEAYGYIAPGCLIFYGLAVLNASKYTLDEVRYLSYGLLLLGIINLWYIGYGIYFWALGFGALHIIYGILMWWKYERTSE
ncbi:hypothetical protein FRZ67_10135 [Panacibacter ginsenosidivorans]|uniref:Uncharacterized protein n=1 Tax=Panacibacter ginsenosidivorans TaxID=1813871 RepID=A0A5B8V9U9_9BACT|nr:hypothetical protein [Panacibacter ginsenosidivorans]QEC67631.1 hypothetical protein FRZ67_10135 [Panacibacter ginsenosidivorans]